MTDTGAATDVAPGRGLFKAAAVLMLVMALAHTLTHFVIATRPDARMLDIHQQMRTHRASLGLGMHPTMFDMALGASLTMSVLLLALGITGLVVVGGPRTAEHDRLLRRLAWVDAGWVAALILVYARHPWIPALVSAALIEVPLLAYLMASRPESRARERATA